MVITPQTTGGWNPLAESPEQAEERRRAEEEFQIRGETADFNAGAEGIRQALGNIGDLDPETGMKRVEEIREIESEDDENPELILAGLETDGEEHDDRLYEAGSPEAEIYERIAARIDTQFGGNAEILIPELFDEVARERNAKRADELFFSEEQLEEQMRNIGEGSESENLDTNRDWFEAHMGEGGNLSDAYRRIRENFVLPPHIEGNNLQEIYENGSEEDALIVNAALSDAFLLEIRQHTLTGRVNYPRQQVEELMREIADPQNSPFEKLQLFGQIHTLVETGVGGRGRKQTEAFRNSQRQSAMAEEQSNAFHVAQTARIQAAEEQNRGGTEQVEALSQETSTGGGDIFTAGDLDLNNTGTEGREAA